MMCVAGQNSLQGSVRDGAPTVAATWPARIIISETRVRAGDSHVCTRSSVTRGSTARASDTRTSHSSSVMLAAPCCVRQACRALLACTHFFQSHQGKTCPCCCQLPTECLCTAPCWTAIKCCEQLGVIHNCSDESKGGCQMEASREGAPPGGRAGLG